MTAVTVEGRLDPSFGWLDGRLVEPDEAAPDRHVPTALRGAWASCVPAPDGRIRLIRDPLGINKLFWARGPDGAVRVAARPQRLVERGHRLDDIRALPRGVVIDIDPECGAVTTHRLHTPPDDEPLIPLLDVHDVGRRVRTELDDYLSALHTRHPDAQVYVCMSGGLDSSGIAALVRQHWADAVGVSFDLRRDGGPSADRITARRLATDLDVPLLEVDVTADELLDGLDSVLTHAIDWRAFNVHAGLVNMALAAGIAAHRDDERDCLVITGDLANEFLADYHVEHYNDIDHYRLPRVPVRQLRDILLRGLDTSHREIGVFAAWGLPTVQPYAVAVDAYLALPSEALAQEGCKRRLDEVIFGGLLPDYVYRRPKARAQVGDDAPGRGVLAACVDHGIDEQRLLQRFAALHATTPGAVQRFIRAGRYRTAVPDTGADDDI